MKNLFKNKSFYIGLAATFAIVAGLYFTLPQADTTAANDQKQTTETTLKEEVNESVIRSAPVEKPVKVPAINVNSSDNNIDNVDETSQDNDADKI